MANSEKSTVWYNKSWEKSGWHRPKMESRHAYTIAELKRLGVKTVLDICCGQGTLLSLCRDNGFLCYGFDFSSTAIEIAQKLNKLDNVWIGNALDEINYAGEYDAYLAIQVLEHIVKDVDVIKNLKPNIPFIFSVPDWAHPGSEHVRKFPTDESIHDRYGELVYIKSIKLFNRRRVVTSMTKVNRDK